MMKTLFAMCLVIFLFLACPAEGPVVDDGSGAGDYIEKQKGPGLFEKCQVLSEDFSGDSHQGYEGRNLVIEEGVASPADTNELAFLEYRQNLTDGRLNLTFQQISFESANLAVFFRLTDDDETLVFFINNSGEFGVYEKSWEVVDGKLRLLERALTEGVVESYRSGVLHNLIIDFSGTASMISLDRKVLLDYYGLKRLKGRVVVAFNDAIEITAFDIFDYTLSPNLKGSVSLGNRLVSQCEVVVYKLMEFDPPQKVLIHRTVTDVYGFYNLFVPPDGVYVIESWGRPYYEEMGYYGGRIIDVSDKENALQAVVILRKEARQ